MKKLSFLLFIILMIFNTIMGNSAKEKKEEFQKFFYTKDIDEEYRVFLEDYEIYKETIYYNGEEISGVDSATFQYIEDFYIKDKDNVYYHNSKVQNADSKTFEYIGYRYARDKKSVYYRGKKIQNADSKTFEIVEYYKAKDKNRYYKHGEVDRHSLKGECPDFCVNSRNSFVFNIYRSFRLLFLYSSFKID